MINIKIFQHNLYYRYEILALIAGAILPFSFAPWNLFWLQFPLLGFLFLVCLRQTPLIAFRRGFFFGLGWFSHGIHWIYYSLHYHGGMPSAVALLTIVLLAAYMSLFPALALYLANRYIKTSCVLMLALIYPLSWMLFDWLRGYFLTGFPWLQIGIAQIDSWLAGYGPLIGGIGTGFLVTVIAGLLAASIIKNDTVKTRPVNNLLLIVVIYIGGFLLGFIHWTDPVAQPIKVSLIQGNIPQAEKWKPENRWPTLKMYRQLSQQNWQSDLIIWPETAIPDYRDRVQNYLDDLAQQAEKNNTDLLLGVFVRNQQTGRYYNSVISLDRQIYKKRHLVPLGEYFPLRPLLGFFAQWVDIPMSDIDSGESKQPLIQVAGQKLGVSICFEDAFDRDVRLDLPQATLLVNVSNDAWFEDSPQPWQHHQIARMRALETGRSLLRATNTGISSVIDPQGRVLAISSQFRREVINARVQAYQGSTPYVIWGNYLTIISALLVLIYFGIKSKTAD